MTATLVAPETKIVFPMPFLRRASAFFIPSIADVIFLGCLIATLISGSKMISADGDPGRHLAVGEHILSSGSIPSSDVFSHTMAGEPFVPYEWLAEVASAASFRLAGTGGVVLLHGSALGLAFAILYRQLRRRDLPVLLSLSVTVLAAAASAIHWLARPHVFTILGAAVFLFVLDRWSTSPRSTRILWVLPPVMAVWVNAHGGFLIGLILVGAYAGAEAVRAVIFASHTARARARSLVVVGAAVCVATFLNPAGPGIFSHVTGYFGKRMLVNLTVEYMSPDFHTPDVAMFSVMLLTLVASLAWSSRRLPLHEALLVGAFTWFSLYSARNIPLFALVAAPVLAEQLRAIRLTAAPASWVRAVQSRLDEWVARRNAAYERIDRRAAGGVISGAVAALLLAFAASSGGAHTLGVAFDPARQPVAAVEHLRANPPSGNGFNELRWGGYLLHTLWPTHRVFIDGQTDFYGEALTQEWLDVVELSDSWQEVLRRHNVMWAIQATDSAFARALAAQPDWVITYRDETATVLERRPDRRS